MNTCTMRQKFQFSLVTTIIVVTLLCMALSWSFYQLDWIRQRNAVISNPNYSYANSSYGFVELPTAPWQLRIFGEGGYHLIGIVIIDEGQVRFENDPFIKIGDPRLTDKECRELERLELLFPEADAYAHVKWAP